MTTTLDWPAILLAEAQRGDKARQQAAAIKDKAKRAEAMQAAERVFPDALCLWADWLEDQGDPACQGVRELLVGMGKRPHNRSGAWAWYGDIGTEYYEESDDLPAVFDLLTSDKVRHRWAWYDSLHAALYDAARAWAGKGKAANTKE